MQKGGRTTILPQRNACATLLFAAGIAFCLYTPATARAQSSPIPIRLKLGALLASDGDVRSFSGSPLFAAELDVDLPQVATGKTRIGIGYYERSKSGRKFTTIPVTISRIFTPPNPTASVTGSPYFGFGVGGYFLRRSGPGGDNELKPGGFGVAGYDFPQKFLGFISFVEAKYHLVAGGANGLSPNGLLVTIGTRL
jgi:hypothetical protein